MGEVGGGGGGGGVLCSMLGVDGRTWNPARGLWLFLPIVLGAEVGNGRGEQIDPGGGVTSSETRVSRLPLQGHTLGICRKGLERTP